MNLTAEQLSITQNLLLNGGAGQLPQLIESGVLSAFNLTTEDFFHNATFETKCKIVKAHIGNSSIMAHIVSDEAFINHLVSSLSLAEQDILISLITSEHANDKLLLKALRETSMKMVIKSLAELNHPLINDYLYNAPISELDSVVIDALVKHGDPKFISKINSNI